MTLLLATPAGALTLDECTRVTHVSHGGEAGHRDFGAGRVGYATWWSQEGVFVDLTVADCASGEALTTRTREERISERAPFDRTDAALKLIEVEMSAAPALFSFDRLAQALKGTGRDIEIAALTDEPCACAALYPEMRGDFAPYEARP
ncbi:MAG: hypothetical protein QNJ13_05080 [Paracoccaceae bacterium]|nr:hypothetical protein [Paracoccaceae bacterium]